MVQGSDRIIQCSIVLGVRKRERERLGAGLHWQREWAEEVTWDGVVGGTGMISLSCTLYLIIEHI